MSNGPYKSQFKRTSNSQWETSTNSGNEGDCFRDKVRLQDKYPHARVIDSKGNLVG